MLDTEYNEEEVMELFKRDSFLEGKAEGLAMGRSEGLALGRSEGLAEGRTEGLAMGRSEGLAEGKAEGLAEGKAEARLSSVKSLMENMSLTLENALDILGLEVEEREAVLKDIKE